MKRALVRLPLYAIGWLVALAVLIPVVYAVLGGFRDTGQLAATLTAFTDRYNQTARPFNWKFTAADLARFLDRISGHEEPACRGDRPGR